MHEILTHQLIKYNWVSFDKWIQLCNHYPNPSEEHFPHLTKFSRAHLQSETAFYLASYKTLYNLVQQKFLTLIL